MPWYSTAHYELELSCGCISTGLKDEEGEVWSVLYPCDTLMPQVPDGMQSLIPARFSIASLNKATRDVLVELDHIADDNDPSVPGTPDSDRWYTTTFSNRRTYSTCGRGSLGTAFYLAGIPITSTIEEALQLEEVSSVEFDPVADCCRIDFTSGAYVITKPE